MKLSALKRWIGAVLSGMPVALVVVCALWGIWVLAYDDTPPGVLQMVAAGLGALAGSITSSILILRFHGEERDDSE